MKKLLALLLCAGMLLGLMAGCTEPATPTESSQSQPAESEPTTPADPWAEYKCITIAEALTLCEQFVDSPSAERYYIRATVKSIDNPAYGQMTIEDETGSITVYGSNNADGSVGYEAMTDKPYAGDEVLLYGTLQNYKGNTKEVQNAWIIDFIRSEVEINPDDYAQMSIADARLTEKGTKVKVSGVVAQITYANGMIPSGVILVDNTSSIYVYDGDLAARCAVGNTITICASKTYWVLESEQSNAGKFGYKGCNQLETAVLLENDEKTSAFDTSWVTESTVKDIIDTHVTTDITSLIFKVTAQIKEVPGNGFTNFYINDLDGATGSYSYSQCNGNDFTWLREFDGKICTVYMVALNAKSTSSDCFWRFLPVKVVDEGFDASSVDAAQLAVKYFGLTQFQTAYTGNPAMDLLTSADFDLLNVKGVKLSYASSDPSVISVSGNVMNCLKTGTAEITVTGEYGGKTYSEKITIQVTIEQQAGNYATVQDAIATELNTVVTVKGIVGPSLVNKTGFYLIDDTGVIAVETSADVLATLEIGYEVVLEATRGFNTKSGGSEYGQTCLKDATVVINNYGKRDYSTASFKGNISVADFYNLDINQDFTTSVYTMKATVLVENGGYSQNIYLTDGTTKVRLYCSSAKQYSWLGAYDGQEVTVEIAACNWNSKNYYVGCVLSVVNADGTKIVNELNFQN